MSDTQAKATPKCPDCKAPMVEGFTRVSVLSKSAVQVRCEGNDEGFHLFTITSWAGFNKFYSHGKLLEALKELVRVVGGTLQGYGILEAPMRAAEAAIQSAAEPGSKADHAVRARWERLGLDPATAPTVFASDVENMVEEELRRLRDGAGRAVVQYSDPAL